LPVLFSHLTSPVATVAKYSSTAVPPASPPSAYRGAAKNKLCDLTSLSGATVLDERLDKRLYIWDCTAAFSSAAAYRSLDYGLLRQHWRLNLEDSGAQQAQVLRLAPLQRLSLPTREPTSSPGLGRTSVVGIGDPRGRRLLRACSTMYCRRASPGRPRLSISLAACSSSKSSYTGSPARTLPLPRTQFTRS
jgi:hypothetical protein